MTEKPDPGLEKELREIAGAVNILDILKEEMAQWLEEAQDDSKHEALENVLNHIEALDLEYRQRREELEKKCGRA